MISKLLSSFRTCQSFPNFLACSLQIDQRLARILTWLTNFSECELSPVVPGGTRWHHMWKVTCQNTDAPAAPPLPRPRRKLLHLNLLNLHPNHHLAGPPLRSRHPNSLSSYLLRQLDNFMAMSLNMSTCHLFIFSASHLICDISKTCFYLHLFFLLYYTFQPCILPFWLVWAATKCTIYIQVLKLLNILNKYVQVLTLT